MAEEELQNSVSISQSPRQSHDVTWRTWVQRSPGGQLSLPFFLRDLSERSLTLASNCRGRRGRPVLASGAARWTLGTAQLQDTGGLGPHRGRHRPPPPTGGVLDHGEGTTGQQDTDRALGFSTSRIREKANSCDI